MNKRILKFISNFFSKPLVKVGFYILGIMLVFLISGVFDDFHTALDKIISIISAQETISVFFAGLLSLGMARFLKRCDYYLEESLKIDDDHHKIIAKYSGYNKTDVDDDKNYCDKTGIYMNVRHVKALGKNELKNREKDIYSKTYKINAEDIKNFKKGKLCLPSVNVFTNVKGNTEIVFNDSPDVHTLPDFVIDHADELLSAHKNSQKRNNNTIRLNDFHYDGHTLALDTMRSTYYHMLITNRCMDYNFSTGLSIRDLYEYDKHISPLNHSKFGNQIGINGLIISQDGYILVEKRDHKKTTWKNKFAQSISLALKEDEVKLNENGILGNTYNEANAVFKGIIEKTIKANFALTPNEYEEFSLKQNFLGIARDLLEGGKPNMYFYVVSKYNAKELAEKLKENAANTDEKTALSTGKLASDFYLVHFPDIEINYNYVMNLNRKKAYKVFRKVYPRSSMRSYMWDRAKHAVALRFKPNLKRECGEALLATISYLEICKDRILPIKPNKNSAQREMKQIG